MKLITKEYTKMVVLFVGFMHVRYRLGFGSDDEGKRSE